MIQLEKYVPFLVREKLTQEEFLLMFCLYRLKYCDVSTKASTLSLMVAYTAEFGIEENGVKRMTSSETKTKLAEKGFLSVTGNGVSLLDLHLTDKATRNFCNEFTAGLEFISHYPARALIQGVAIPLKTSDRAVMSRLYCSRIQFSAQEHKEVMADLAYGIEAELVNLSLENFIRSEQWRDFRKERLNESSSTASSTIDNDF
jgi:hypothetical protein